MTGRTTPERCGHCGLIATPEGHDGCLGDLSPHVKNACCGHGNDSAAYIQFDGERYSDDPNANRVAGFAAVALQNILKREKTK